MNFYNPKPSKSCILSTIKIGFIKNYGRQKCLICQNFKLIHLNLQYIDAFLLSHMQDAHDHECKACTKQVKNSVIIHVNIF